MLKNEDYKKLETYLNSKGVFSPKTTKKVVKELKDFFNNYLRCSFGGEWLEDENFYKSKIHSGRRSRNVICKFHWKEYNASRK